MEKAYLFLPVMKSIYSPVLILLAAMSLHSCSLFGDKKEKDSDSYSEHRQQMEQEAQGRLSQARAQLSQGAYSKARATVEQMRQDCYLALEARRQGILLMDSIDLADSKALLARVDSAMHTGVDSIGKGEFDEACRKVEFYERKLKHDTAQRP